MAVAYVSCPGHDLVEIVHSCKPKFASRCFWIIQCDKSAFVECEAMNTGSVIILSHYVTLIIDFVQFRVCCSWKINERKDAVLD